MHARPARKPRWFCPCRRRYTRAGIRRNRPGAPASRHWRDRQNARARTTGSQECQGHSGRLARLYHRLFRPDGPKRTFRVRISSYFYRQLFSQEGSCGVVFTKITNIFCTVALKICTGPKRFTETLPLAELTRRFRNPEKFIVYCRECGRYGHCWACPPYEFDPSEVLAGYTVAWIAGIRIIPDEALRNRLATPEEATEAGREMLARVRAAIDPQLLAIERKHPGSRAFFAGTRFACPEGACTRHKGISVPPPGPGAAFARSVRFRHRRHQLGIASQRIEMES
ncbi:MAG: DUF2284 domain-containing protein [Alistipes indistinctus]